MLCVNRNLFTYLNKLPIIPAQQHMYEHLNIDIVQANLHTRAKPDSCEHSQLSVASFCHCEYVWADYLLAKIDTSYQIDGVVYRRRVV